MEDVAKQFKGFRQTHYYTALVGLLESGKQAGIIEGVNLYSKDILDQTAIKRISTQTKMFSEVISRINGLCDYADQKIETINEDEEETIKWRV